MKLSLRPLTATLALLQLALPAATAVTHVRNTTNSGNIDAVDDVKDAKWHWDNDRLPGVHSALQAAFFNTFKPDDVTQTCAGSDRPATALATRPVRGANLGGWLVLEPWITPTLFYQFLGTPERFGAQAPEKTAMDMYTFCTALGKEEANRQLRIHYDQWVTEKDIAALAEAGINSLRVPVGDWMFNPYEPFIDCTTGAVEALDRVADLALKYNMDILLDIHGLIGSQNGFDNSGKSTAVKWTSIASTQPVGTTTFEHWPIRQAEWVGTFDPATNTYSDVNYEHLTHSLDTVTAIVDRYAGHAAVRGLEPVNEPWEHTPMALLQQYYWKSYQRVKARAPHWQVVLHDSFRFGVQFWAHFLRGCPDVALDTHVYQAWHSPGTAADYFANACEQKHSIAAMETASMPVIVGEWSLGTDNCAMWLNGFNDNLPGFPTVPCRLTECPVHSTYLAEGFPGTPLDRTKPLQGPYGTGVSGPAVGLCPVTSNTSFGQQSDRDERTFTRSLNLKKLNAFAAGHGWYFWNFKTELGSRWSFLDLVRRGAFPANVSSYDSDAEVTNACRDEDAGAFTCGAKRGVPVNDLQRGLDYACGEVDCAGLGSRFETIEERCDWAFNAYWQTHREEGSTCDFGGAAHLLALPSASSAALQLVEVSWSFSSDVSTWTLVAGVIAGASGLTAALLALVRQRRRGEYSPLLGHVVRGSV
ncbi:unnamed protein product [Hyaloperonospora brassicae]|uniref:X8 domain-containing protein n=1 Tax=Hyaloperonospora brassicae TaxID=162125 RepID=A0AAV0UYE6_HYABA|nr:unnamed protein product [Hyaloperonospora brassicae]